MGTPLTFATTTNSRSINTAQRSSSDRMKAILLSARPKRQPPYWNIVPMINVNFQTIFTSYLKCQHVDVWGLGS